MYRVFFPRGYPQQIKGSHSSDEIADGRRTQRLDWKNQEKGNEETSNEMEWIQMSSMKSRKSKREEGGSFSAGLIEQGSHVGEARDVSKARALLG